jgi:hypothetical protein
VKSIGRCLAAAALAGIGAAASAVDAPRRAPPAVTCHADGTCRLSTLPPVLSDSELLGHLKSGLTTTLVLSLKIRKAQWNGSSSARVDVRFEPWDEIFLVASFPPRDAPQRSRHSSLAALETWWKKLAVTFPVHAPPGAKARVTLRVVPFSEGEETETRQWYAQTLRRERQPRAGGAEEGLGEMLDAVTLMSIKRRDAMELSWSVAVYFDR